MNFNFYIGRISIEIAKNKLLSGYHFKFEIVFYGKGWYRWKRNMRKLKRKRNAQYR